MAFKSQCDVAVIGSGPGGYVAAIRAAQLGLDTVCIERENLGGICLNWGCIPTKALLRSAEILELCERAGEFGINAENISFDFPAIIKRSRDISTKISKGVAFLLRKNAVEHIPGTAQLAGPNQIAIELTDGGSHTLHAKHIILATGARARALPHLRFDGQRIIGYREAMTLPQKPASLVVIGAGAIGVEFASFYRSLGSEVTIVEYADRLVPNEDDDISAELKKALEKRGMRCLVGHSVTQAHSDATGVDIAIENVATKAEVKIRADVVLMATGTTGNIENIGLEGLGIETERGWIKVDDYLRTKSPSIYAIGDVIGSGLAHTAMSEGVYVAELIAGQSPSPIPYDAVPACTYCHPEIASVGLTQKQAEDRGIAIKVGTYPFRPLGKTMAAGEYPGFAKFIFREDDHSIVGAHLIGPAVTDLIAVPTLAKTTEVNAESFIHTIYAHPTFSEALKEAAEGALGHAIHM